MLTKYRAAAANRRRQVSQLVKTLGRPDLLDAYKRGEIETLGQALAIAAGWEVDRIAPPPTARPELPDGVPPPPGELLYDLAIAVKKFGRNVDKSQQYILWWKIGRQPVDYIYKRGLRITLEETRPRLVGGYQPNPKTEVQENQTIYRYKSLWHSRPVK